MTRTQMNDVLIVGAGPTGLALASELARRGIACRIIDQELAYHNGSRARGLLPPTLEIFENMGILERLSAHVEPWRPVRIYDRHNQVVRENDMATNMAALSTSGVPRLPMKISQQNTEATLREYLESYSIPVELNCQLVDFSQSEEGVIASVLCAGKREEIQARYLIGCDGGHSAVRKGANIEFRGETGEDEYGIVGNVSVSGLEPMFGIWQDSDRPSGFLLMLDQINNDSWFFTGILLPDEYRTFTPTLEGLQRFFDEQVGVPGVSFSQLSWISTYRPQNMRVAEQYRNGRVLLAGDAAHIGMIHGMETGIHDVYNLGWKLALVLEGASDTLLDTYHDERFSIAQYEFASGGFSAGARAIITGLSDQENEPVTRNEGSTPHLFGDTYRGSRLSRNLDDTTNIRAGDLAPSAPRVQAQSGETLRLFDLFRGMHFTLLTFSDRPVSGLPDMPGMLRTYTITRPGIATTAEDTILIDRNGETYRAYGITKDALVLVRPDGYVGLTTGSVEFQPILDYLHDVTGGALAEQVDTQTADPPQLKEIAEESQAALFRKFHNF
ncbi:MAG TPA: FAD-dependent oxidoreductase [Ktedonosporobacter sp.]|nr:FAD-dependent oxidoreductase [Ktedonosporobacter sp.]